MRVPVLVVEDETHARLAITEFLGRLGYEVRAVADAEAALAVRRTFRPDVLICDYLLPGGMNGVELADTLRCTQPGLKVLIMSGMSPDQIAEDMEALGFDAFLSKPLSLITLRGQLSQLTSG